MTKGLRILELSDLSLVSTRSGKALRLTVTDAFIPESAKDDDAESFSVSGCLILRDKKGVLHFAPPMNKIGAKAYSMMLVSPAFEKRILAMLGRNKKGARWLEKIGLSEFLRDLPDDPELATLPTEIQEEKEDKIEVGE